MSMIGSTKKKGEQGKLVQWREEEEDKNTATSYIRVDMKERFISRESMSPCTLMYQRGKKRISNLTSVHINVTKDRHEKANRVSIVPLIRDRHFIQELFLSAPDSLVSHFVSPD